jgi:hypothetical protein
VGPCKMISLGALSPDLDMWTGCCVFVSGWNHNQPGTVPLLLKLVSGGSSKRAVFQAVSVLH